METEEKQTYTTPTLKPFQKYKDVNKTKRQNGQSNLTLLDFIRPCLHQHHKINTQ
jgi:hypothetical protein